MFRRLPYRIQIPVGLSAAILVTAILVTAVSARFSATSARQETLASLERGVVLVVAQARPLLVADDTWRTYALLRDTAALIPGAATGQGRLAVLDAEGRVFAASDPQTLQTGMELLGKRWHGEALDSALVLTEPQRLDRPDGAVIGLEPIRSEDGQVLGHVFIEIEGSVFAPDWVGLGKTAGLGVMLAVALLVPMGWLIGSRMTQPVARLVRLIERIGKEPPAQLQRSVPRTQDPELNRISAAIHELIAALQQKEIAEARALSAERLAAVGRMTAAVAHEINNPLAGLLTATQTLRLHGQTDAIRNKTIDLIDRGLQQVKTTIAALLPQARIEDRALTPSDLEDVTTLVGSTAFGAGVTVQSQLEVESALRVPSAPIRQVMLNLLLNAIKAAGQGGSVHATLKANPEAVRLVVCNSGPRLTQEKFEATLNIEGGHDPRGFGLWVCRELANHYRGSFELDPSWTEGTRLVFTVPNHQEATGKP